MQASSSKSLLPSHVRAVTEHRPQSLIVNELLRTGFLDWSDVRNPDDPESGEPREIYEWHFFFELV